MFRFSNPKKLQDPLTFSKNYFLCSFPVPSGPVFCLADAGETYAVDESVATCSMEPTNDAVYWISQANLYNILELFKQKQPNMSIDCAHFSWNRLDVSRQLSKDFKGILISWTLLIYLKHPRKYGGQDDTPVQVGEKQLSFRLPMQTNIGAISSLTMPYFLWFMSLFTAFVNYTWFYVSFQLFCVCAHCHVSSSLHKGFAFVWVPYWWFWEWPVWPVFVRNLRYHMCETYESTWCPRFHNWVELIK